MNWKSNVIATIDEKSLSSAVNVDLSKLGKEKKLNDPTDVLKRFFIENYNHIDINKPILITKWKNHRDNSRFVLWLQKLKGTGSKRPSREPLIETILTVFGAFISMLVITIIDHFWLRPRGYVFAIAPFAAMATVMFYYHSYRASVSQPRNTIFANTAAAVLAVAIRKCVGEELLWFGCTLAVSLTMALMCLTNTVNPPAGATAMTVFYGGKLVADQQFMFALIPATVGTLLFLFLVLLINNLSPKRRYPTYWL